MGPSGPFNPITANASGGMHNGLPWIFLFRMYKRSTKTTKIYKYYKFLLRVTCGMILILQAIFHLLGIKNNRQTPLLLRYPKIADQPANEGGTLMIWYISFSLNTSLRLYIHNYPSYWDSGVSCTPLTCPLACLTCYHMTLAAIRIRLEVG